jgi:hypothetical protein
MKHLQKFNEMAIRIRKKEAKKSKKTDPHYILKYNYMIGDANGDTSEKVKISKDNPFLERYYKLLNSLKPTQGTWGIILDRETIYKTYEENQITKDDYYFLMRIMFEEYEEEEDMESPNPKEPKFKVDKKDKEYANEFFEGVRSETEYSFLVFEGLSLKYVDENGEKHDADVD